MGYHTYEQINSSLTWSAAKADAESRGGYLATITSLEEKNKVEQSGLLIPGWEGVTLKLRYLAMGTGEPWGPLFGIPVNQMEVQEKIIL